MKLYTESYVTLSFIKFTQLISVSSISRNTSILKLSSQFLKLEMTKINNYNLHSL